MRRGPFLSELGVAALIVLALIVALALVAGIAVATAGDPRGDPCLADPVCVVQR